MKAGLYGELFLWNRNLDRLIPVLQRMETLSIRPKQEMKAFEVRLEEIRAALNADVTEAMATRERSDQSLPHETTNCMGRKDRGRKHN